MWDTTVASRLRGDGQLDQALTERAAAGDPVALAAPTIMEVVRGLQSAAVADERFVAALHWWTALVTSELVDVIGLDAEAAIVAGRLRSHHPLPPGARRGRQSKPDRRAGWVLDLQIAACAWTAGRTLASHNRSDFDVIAEAIAILFPDATRLEIIAPP